MRLDLRTDQGDDFIAQQGDRHVKAAFAAAMQPDHERVGLSVALEGTGFIRGIGQRFIPDLTGRLAREGTFVEIKGGQFFDKEGNPYNPYKKETWNNKYKLLLENNVQILKQEKINEYLKYIKIKYGKGYLKKFKIIK
jgi:hypothetical protein